MAILQPRDPRNAARAVSTLCLVGAAVTVIFAPLAPSNLDVDPLGLGIGAATLMLVALISLAARFFDESNRMAWALCPLLAVAAITEIDFVTSDATVSAQIFFLFPVLYGASQLRRSGALVLTAAALAGECCVVFSMLPFKEALPTPATWPRRW